MVFLAEVGVSLPVFGAGTALMSCSGIGATPQMLGYFPSTYATAPAYPVPVIPGVLAAGSVFQSNGAEAATASGLHLVSLNTLSIKDASAAVKNQDAYSLVVNPQGVGTTSIRYRAIDQIWEADSQVLSSTQISNVDAIEHSGATYSTNGVNIQKTEDPLTVEASGSIFGVSFSLALSLFGSANSFPTGTFEYDTAYPQTGSGCMPSPPLDNSMPTNSTGAFLLPFNGESLRAFFFGRGANRTSSRKLPDHTGQAA